MNPIVLATDGSPSAEKATKLAVELARETGSKLYVIAAWYTPLTNYTWAPVMTMPEIEEADKKRAHDAATAALELARAADVDAESFVRNGEPVKMISETAENCHAALVVVGSHGWGTVRRFLFGSVSSAVLHDAPCPVLVARLDEEKSTEDVESKEAAHA